MRKRPGQPRKPAHLRRDGQVRIACTAADCDAFAEAARLSEQTLSTWGLSVLRKAARAMVLEIT
jgi:hypothetical protein